jgi:hypothetical protein
MNDKTKLLFVILGGIIGISVTFLFFKALGIILPAIWGWIF